MNTSTNVQYYNKNIFYVFIAFASIFSILFGIQWYTVNSSIKEYKLEKERQSNSLMRTKTNLLDVTKLESLKNLDYVVIKKKDLKEINENLNLLAEEIYSEKNQAVNLIDKDIDRLNLYMAIGIGFIAILGIFVPILVNFLSHDDLKEKQKNLDLEFINLNDKVKDFPKKDDIQSAIDKSNILLSKSNEIDEIKRKTDNISPKISTISLQIAINRLFNVSPTAISKIARSGNCILYKSLFEKVKSELEKCKSDDLHSVNNQSLNETFLDFSEMLLEEKFKFNTYLKKRNLVTDFDLLSSSLITLGSSNEDNEILNYENTIDIMDRIINSIN